MVANTKVKMYTTKEASVLLHVHTNTIRRWCDLGIMKSYRIGARGDRRILEDEIVRLLSNSYHSHKTIKNNAEQELN